MDYYNIGQDEENLPPKIDPNLNPFNFDLFNWDITDEQRAFLKCLGIGLTIIGGVLTLALIIDDIKDNNIL